MKLTVKVFAVFMVCAFFFGACAQSNKKKIGVSVATMQESVYTFMKKAMMDNKDKDNIKIIWLSADNMETNQVSNIEDLITQKIDCLILHSVNTAAATELVKKAKAAGIPVVAMDRLPVGSQVDCYVTADSFKVGQIQAKYLAEKIGGKGNVVICQGEAGNSVAREITNGNLSVLKKYPGINIVVNQMHKSWARDLAMATVENALTKYKNNIAGVLCNNSGMAMGAAQAVIAQNLVGKVVVVGSDADKDACEAIVKGTLSADVDKMPYELGLQSYKTAVALINKEKIAADKTVSNQGARVKVKFTPVKLITKENISEMKYRWSGLK
ncbi:MAG: substrate-binding domain-containing protein [Elusimicrobiota bacterium]